MSKPILASLALALVSKGILELDEPVLPRLKSWHLPQSRSDGLDTSRITLRRLLSHSAGFNVHSYPDRHHTAPPVTIQQVLNGIDNPVECLTRLTSQPGTLVSYTGAGLSIVQVLIEDTLGVPYIHALREHLLGPLGLDATSAAPNDIPGMELSACHSGGISNNLVDPPPGNPRTPFELHTVGALGASGLFSSPRDVAKVFELPLPGPDNAPPGRGIIREDLARAMIQDQRHGAQGDMWGLGVLLYRSPKGTISYRHGGQRQAWFIHAEGSAGQNLVVTMMANADYLGACAINPVIAQIRKALALFEP